MEKETTIDMVMKPEKRVDSFGTEYPWKSYNMAATITNQSVIRGSASTTAYTNLGIQWIRKAMDAAKARQRFPNAFSEFAVPEGNDSMFVPIRNKYMAASTWESTNEEIGVNTNITWTDITTVDGVNFAPTDGHEGVEITNKAVRTSAINIVQFCREELEYRMADVLDTACSTAFDDAAIMSNTANAMHTIFGGDATDADDSIDDGDILTTDMVAKARRLLMSDLGYYWNSNVWTKSAISTNPWEPEPNAPFILYIAPEMEEALVTDSQFVNASEYGGNEVVLGGEIGQYLGVKIVSTSKVPSFSSGESFTNGGGTISEDTNIHTCFMVKGQKAGGIAWGLKPSIKVFDWPSGAKKRIALEYSYAADSIYDDSIVKLVVSDI